MKGSELLAQMRDGYPVAALDNDTRAGLIAALLSDFRKSDADMIVALTRDESAMLARDHVNVGQDGLFACCWMLFMIGRLNDVPVVFEAKMTDFDTYCGIDSVFLVPHGVEATLEYAVAHGLDDLCSWVSDMRGDVDAAIKGWREATYFDDRPPTDSTLEELSAWMRQ